MENLIDNPLLGEAFRIIYASGGHPGFAGGHPKFSHPDFKGKLDYDSQEPSEEEGKIMGDSARQADTELNREAGRHLGDRTLSQVRAALGSRGAAFDDALANARSIGYETIACVHRLNRLRADADLQEHEDDPPGLVLGFVGLPAKDRPSAPTPNRAARRSVRKCESIAEFLNSTQIYLASLQQQSVREGLCIPGLLPGTNADTHRKNAENCEAAVDPMAELDRNIGAKL